MFTTEFIANGDIQTAYHDLGQGVPFLLVHGFTGSKLDFVNQAAWFVENHRVILYDQRGHGESSNLAPYNFATLMADLIGFMDALEIPSCHLLGHSLGGMVALRAMLAYPERFRSLLLMDTAPYGLALFPNKAREQLISVITEGGCQALLPNMRQQRPNGATQRGIDFLGEAEHWRRIKVKLTQMDPQAFEQLSIEADQQTSVLDQLSHISVPTSIIVGRKDKPFLRPAKHMHKAIEDSRLIRIPNAAHSPQYENADVWRDAINAHLAWAEG